jgi:hypothetical protein
VKENNQDEKDLDAVSPLLVEIGGIVVTIISIITE